MTLQAHAAGQGQSGAPLRSCHGPRPGLACTAKQLLGLLKDGGDFLALLGHLGRNTGHGIVPGQH